MLRQWWWIAVLVWFILAPFSQPLPEVTPNWHFWSMRCYMAQTEVTVISHNDFCKLGLEDATFLPQTPLMISGRWYGRPSVSALSCSQRPEREREGINAITTDLQLKAVCTAKSRWSCTQWMSILTIHGSGGFRGGKGVQIHPPLAASNVFLRK